MRKLLTHSLLLVVMCSLTACGGAAQANEDFAVQDAPTTTSLVTTPPRPASPDPSLQADLDRIAHVLGDVRRDVWGSRRVSQHNQNQLSAIFATPELQFQQVVWRDEAELGPQGLRSNPDDQRWTLLEIVTRTDTCVYAKVSAREDHNMTDGSRRGFVGDFVLRKWPHDTAINPTPWVLQMYKPEMLEMVDAETACG